jgi:hypothetical protein
MLNCRRNRPRNLALKNLESPFSRSHATVIRVYGEVGNAIETYAHTGDFKES